MNVFSINERRGTGYNVSCGAFLCHKNYEIGSYWCGVLQDTGQEASKQGTVRWKAIMNEIISSLYVASFIFLSPMDVREQQVWLKSNTSCANDISLSVFTGLPRDSVLSVADIYGSGSCIVWQDCYNVSENPSASICSDRSSEFRIKRGNRFHQHFCCQLSDHTRIVL